MLNRIVARVKCRARQWHSSVRQVRAMLLKAVTGVRFDALDRDRDFPSENFYTISTDTHIDDLVILPIILLRGANKNTTGTVHFESLLDQNLLLAGRDTVRHHPGGAASGGRTGSRIVAAVKNHPRVQTGFRIDRLAA